MPVGRQIATGKKLPAKYDGSFFVAKWRSWQLEVCVHKSLHI